MLENIMSDLCMTIYKLIDALCMIGDVRRMGSSCFE